MNAAPATTSQARRLTFAVTAASATTAVVLSLLKLFVWWRGGSVAVMASLADSALDIIAALATFIAVRVAAAPPDAEHRFGHGKAEAFSSLLQAGLVFATAALIGEEAVRRLISGQRFAEEGWAFAVMTVSLVASAALVAAQTYVLSRTRSAAVSGDRAHYAADVASSLAALAGVGLARLTGDPRFDAGAGLFVAVWLLIGALKVFQEAGDLIMDHELHAGERQSIVDCVLADPDIHGVHDLRTRAVGAAVHMQMHVDLDPLLTLAEVHGIVEAAETRLAKLFPTADVLIHPDPLGHAESPGRFGPESPTG